MASNDHSSLKLLHWYRDNRRDLPWRNTNDPYIIWLSEILMQQTRVAQGLPYFERFISHYPSVTDLANAPIDEVLKLWQGLGYYSRAHNLHQTAQKVVSDFQGRFPSEFKELIKLKGIGAYTAAAISSIAAGEKQAVVDGNVYRVLSRLYGVETPINSSHAHRIFSELSLEMMGNHDPGTFNQALMELGALVCTPRNPLCEACPISDTCFALKNKSQRLFPKKTAAKAKTFRHFTYILLTCQGKFNLKRRDMTEIWKGMYEPMLIESDRLLEHMEAETHLNKKYALERIVQFPDSRHLLTHRTLHIRFFTAEVKNPDMEKEDNWINLSELAFFALPKPISDFFSRYGETLF
jgi:A/G-specific adenine glycosylase